MNVSSSIRFAGQDTKVHEIKMPTAPKRKVSLNEWHQHHKWPSMDTLLYLISNAHENGFDEVISRDRWRIMIDEEKFFEYFDVAKEAYGSKT